MDDNEDENHEMFLWHLVHACQHGEFGNSKRAEKVHIFQPKSKVPASDRDCMAGLLWGNQ